MAPLLSWLDRLWARLAYRPVDPAGPAAALGRVLAASAAGEGLDEVLEPEEARPLLVALGAGEGAPELSAYPGWAELDPVRRRWFARGYGLLAEELGGEGRVELADLAGVLLPRPGPGRQPVLEGVEGGGEEDWQAVVVYGYRGTPGSHRLPLYRHPDGPWLFDVVAALVAAGRMQEALGEVQTPGCPSDSERFQV